MAATNATGFQYQHTNLVMMIGGQVLVLAILAILFLFSSSPRSGLVPEGLQAALGMVNSRAKNASSS